MNFYITQVCCLRLYPYLNILYMVNVQVDDVDVDVDVDIDDTP